jgi:cob(I)alamin adenosyltransferase
LALWSEVVSWLSGLTAVPSQCLAGASGLDTAVLPGNSGGSAPDSHRLPITTDLGRLDASQEWVSKAPRPVDSVSVVVNLTRIYTKLGDGGETHLGDMSRVRKTHPRIEAYGTVDELNSYVGVVLTLSELPEDYRGWLERIQNDLFDVGADIAAPEDPERERLRVLPAQTAWLEQRCDEVNATLEPLKSFVLPGGTQAAAHLHVARTICRRAERLAVACGEEINAEVVRYLNRLSDLLFILARGANGANEPLWQPGRFRD